MCQLYYVAVTSQGKLESSTPPTAICLPKSAMGFCFSCCRRRRRSTEDDREPLLSPHPAAEAPAGSYTDEAADILAALRVGKLPSQEQTNTALRQMLRLDVLYVNGGDSKSARVLGRAQQYGPLSERGKTVINDIREIIEAIVQFGMEKNSPYFRVIPLQILICPSR